ncbi:MAG TPA: phage baseplate assembly protein [Acetobacteraceae bacterium]|jgi:phage gp45-like|nr:phage baseplate assembly protein [Acetobacteraceae bacterium]
MTWLEVRVAELERELADIKRLLGVPFAIAQSTLPPIDSGPVQTVQLQLDPLSLRDNVPLLFNYGHTAVPPIGANVHVAFLDGQRSKAVGIASGHQTYRLTNLALGDSALYDSRGAFMWLTASGPSVNGAGNPTLITGDLHVTGEIIRGFGGADQVTLGQHRHGTGTTAAGTSVPTPGL